MNLTMKSIQFAVSQVELCRLNAAAALLSIEHADGVAEIILASEASRDAVSQYETAILRLARELNAAGVHTG